MSKVMNLTDKLYQLKVLDRIAETDWPKGNQAPFVVELDPTAVCDLACPGCISEDLIQLGNRFSDERLLTLGQELIDIGVKAVILIGGGEPLAHRMVGELIRLLGTNDVHVGITTNGSFIDKHLDVISEYSKWTRVSMDAATNDTFKVLRPTKSGGSKFDLIIDNMRRLSKTKKGKLGFSFLIQTEADGVGMNNIREIYPAAVLAREIGCDYFEVKPTYQFRDGVTHALVKHAGDLMEWAAREVARLDELETASFKVLRAINLQQSLDRVNVPQEKQYKYCPSTQLRTTIAPTGVFVCPYWRGKEAMQLGDVRTETFKDVWEGERRTEVMACLDAGRDCNFHCLRHETNNTILGLVAKLKAGERPMGTEEFDRFV